MMSWEALLSIILSAYLQTALLSLLTLCPSKWISPYKICHPAHFSLHNSIFPKVRLLLCLLLCVKAACKAWDHLRMAHSWPQTGGHKACCASKIIWFCILQKVCMCDCFLVFLKGVTLTSWPTTWFTFLLHDFVLTCVVTGNQFNRVRAVWSEHEADLSTQGRPERINEQHPAGVNSCGSCAFYLLQSLNGSQTEDAAAEPPSYRSALNVSFPANHHNGMV